MITPELYMIGKPTKLIFYLCFDQKVFRVVASSVLDLYLEQLPLFDPTKKYPDVSDVDNFLTDTWTQFAYSKRDNLSMKSKKSMPLPDYLIKKWDLDLAGSTGAVDSTNS